MGGGGGGGHGLPQMVAFPLAKEIVLGNILHEKDNSSLPKFSSGSAPV